MEWSYPWMPQYWKLEVKSRDDFWFGTVTTSFLPIEQSAPISVCMYTHSSSILEEAHLHKHFTHTYRYTARAKNTYSGESVYEWSTHTAMNVCLNEELLRRRHPTIDAVLRLPASAKSKCISGKDNLGLKGTEDEKLCLDWRKLIAAINCAVWSAFTVEYFNDYNDYNNLSTTCMDNRRSPTIWKIFNCNYINKKVAIDKSSTSDP